MGLNFKIILLKKNSIFFIGVLFFITYLQSGCKGNKETSSNNISYISPIDSIDFNYSNNSWKNTTSNYSENRFGQNMFIDTSGNFQYISINSENKLHTFNFKTNEHIYSKQICRNKIDAYKIESSFIYLLYNNILYTKDYQLNTIDSFAYPYPHITKKHDIDFSIENNSNLFKVKNYFVLMYYIVDENLDGMNLYSNTDYLFYYFNRDTSFFANKGCQKSDTSFQYFRYPAITNDSKYIYYAPRVMNCISKSNEAKTLINLPIDTLKNNYLTIKLNDQYEISKLKKYRFSTDYNRDIISTTNNIYLIKEFPIKIYYKENIRTYERNLEIKKFDKELNLIKNHYIEDTAYSLAYINNNKIYLFNFNKNKCYIYEI